MAPPIADTLVSPLVFQGVKFPASMKKRPAVAISARGMNFRTVVHSWNTPMLRTPERLTAAGIHRPTRAITIDPKVLPPLFTNFST